MKKQFDDLKKFLDERNVEYELFEHEPVYTSEQASRVRGVELKTGVKALVFMIKESGKFILALVSADRKVDTARLSEFLGKKIRLASPDDVLKRCGCEIGSVHPFGNLFGIETYMDKGILENNMVNFNAGLHEISIKMHSKDLSGLINPILCEISA